MEHTEPTDTNIERHVPEAREPTATELALGRNAILSQLFGTDLDYAKDSGLIDAFVYDPKEGGYDGILHTLIGDEYGGFHSESAVRLLNENPKTASLVRGTAVDRAHLIGKPSSKARDFVERPFEPYLARVEVNGKPKVTLTPEGNVRGINNSMYPKEYDPLATLQGVVHAWRHRDIYKDELRPSPFGDVVHNLGKLPLLDGVAEAPITLWMNPSSSKIVTAFPQSDRRGFMRLTEEQARHHLLD